MDRIDLVDLKLDCILGVLDAEQRAPQPLVGRVSLWLDLDASGHSGRLDQTVDYAAVATQLSFVAAHGRFRLLESMSLAMLRLVLLPPAAGEARARVQRMALRLRKPTILGELATPGTRFSRDAAWAARRDPVPLADGVRADVLVDTGREGAWRVHLEEGAAWAPAADRAVFVIAGRVDAGEGVSAGSGASWGPGQAARVVARGGAALLVVKVPPPP